MIHLHSMFSSETNFSTAGQSNSAALSQAHLDSFHGALSDAVSSTLEKFGIHPKDVNISITRASEEATPPATSTSSTPADTKSAASTSTSSEAPNGGYDPFLQAAFNNPYSTAPTESSTSSTAAATTVSSSTADSSTSAADQQEAFDNAYWASQPAPVQALRTMQNQEQREAVATQLANEGYSIDVPIMVWGWDPSITTAMRQSEGYTWVPSALQNPVEVAPGLPNLGTLAAYNPNNPPAGSITV
jgi:hypothetical protein